MTKLEQLIKELCPNGVEYKPLDELGTFLGGLSGKSKEDFKDGNFKFITYMNVFSNISLNLDVTDTVKIGEGEKQNTIQYGDVLFTGSSETPNECGMSSVLTVKTAEKLYLNSFCFIYRFNDPELFLPSFSKYLFRSDYLRKQIIKTASGVTRFNVSKAKMAKVKIPVPPIEAQAEIVKILDKYTESITALQQVLEKELTARKKQYEYYRDYLLQSEKNETKVCVTDICDDIFLGLTSKVDYVQNGGVPLVRANNMTNGLLSFNDVRCISKEQHEKLTKNHKVQNGDILISKSGTLGAVCIVDTNVEFSIYESLICLRPNKRVNNRFLLHFFRSTKVQKAMLGKKVGNAIQHLNLQTFRELYMRIPPLKEQERIVSILDRFDKLCNDISEDLPAEIEARRKQYEYYRDKLLSFEEVKV